jgi:hypothetical protein
MVKDFRRDLMQSWPILSGENLKGNEVALL